MSGGIIGDVPNEKFELPNKYIILIEYGVYNYSTLFSYHMLSQKNQL